MRNPENVFEDNQQTESVGYFVKPVDGANFSSFKIGGLKHNFDKHPLMQLDKLKELAEYLMPREQCRFVTPDLNQSSKFWHYSKATDGRNLDEVFAQIYQPKSWIALYNVEAHPAYKEFLEEVISYVRPVVEKEQGQIFLVQGFLFISSPPSVTPFHIDRENNFWLQMRGKKMMTVFDHLDRELVPGEAVEDFVVHRNLEKVRLEDKFRARGNDFKVGAGDGVYFPSTSPHMTLTSEELSDPGDEVSVSIGVVFYTDSTKAEAQVHQCNSLLRRFGLKPQPPGNNAFIDMLKRPVGKLYASLRARFKGYNPPPGTL